ncbi:MAG: hypothetical protein JWL87_665 [Candidatus Adlerbacteria bacterium]|nr:hypothetical protein [Candidatus Adlerbacteria bacterium]
MQNTIKAFVFGALALSGLAFAAPASAQTYYPQGYSSYSYPQYQQSAYPVAPVYSPYSACPALTYNLTLGSSDRTTQGQVSALQRFLANRYGDSRISGGYYGSLTVYYVTRFQQEQGVYPATGGVGALTRTAIARTCGGSSYPGYPTTPSNPGSTTFRLDRNFSLSEGQTSRLSGGELTVTLNQIGSSYSYYQNNNDEARVTLVMSCRAGTYCIYAPQQSYTLEEGDQVTFQGYEVELVSLSSSKATFRVVDTDNNNDEDATIEVTAPKSSTQVDQGDTVKITWKSSDEPSDSAVILDLYTSGGSKIGTIAISDDSDGSYTWRVPERSTYCTMQYPNGLCGYDLDGRYYVKATLVRGNGFNGGTTLDTDTSATFTIDR